MHVTNAEKPSSVRQLLEYITPGCTPERKPLHVINLASSKGSYTFQITQNRETHVTWRQVHFPLGTQLVLVSQSFFHLSGAWSQSMMLLHLSLAFISHFTFFLSGVILEWRDFHCRLGCYVLNMIENKVKAARVNNWVKQFSTNRSLAVFVLFYFIFKRELSVYSVELSQISVCWLNAHSLASWIKPYE